MSGTWSEASINKDMAAFIGRYVRDIPATSSGTVTTYLNYTAATKYSWAFQRIRTVQTMYIDHNGHIARWFTMMEGQQLLTLIFKMGQGVFHFLFCQSGQPILHLWLCTTCRPTDYPRSTTNNRCPSVDAHVHDSAGRVLPFVLHRKGARNSYMTDCNLSAVWLPRTHDQTSLMLGWRSFSRWGREGIAICSAYKGSEKFLYDCPQPIRSVITQDAAPKIIDALLMLMFKMEQGGYCNPYCL